MQPRETKAKLKLVSSTNKREQYSSIRIWMSLTRRSQTHVHPQARGPTSASVHWRLWKMKSQPQAKAKASRKILAIIPTPMPFAERRPSAKLHDIQALAQKVLLPALPTTHPHQHRPSQAQQNANAKTQAPPSLLDHKPSTQKTQHLRLPQPTNNGKSTPSPIAPWPRNPPNNVNPGTHPKNPP